MGFDFRAAADQHGEPYLETQDAPEEAQPPACSYCGATEFSTEDHGRGLRAKCDACGGTMTSATGFWVPELIGSPHNHPSPAADPASGGVGGTGNIPQRTTVEQLRTAMPSRNHPAPEGISFGHREFESGTDEHTDLDESNPGWHHYRITAHLPEERAVGYLDYSAHPHPSPDAPGIEINTMGVRGKYQRRGVASAMQDHLRELHPEHVINHGGRSPQGVSWWGQYDDPAPHLDWDGHQNNPWKVGMQDPELRFHFTSLWADVRAKAMRIRAEGGVVIKIASADGVGGEVRGDHGTYETVLSYLPGSRKVGSWHCGCKWGEFAFDRSPAYQRFAGRLCSHGLAMQLEAQSRHPREVTESHPSWMRQHRTRHTVESALAEEVYSDGHGLDLTRPPVYAFAVTALAGGADPAQALQVLLDLGVEHVAGKALLREAMADPLVLTAAQSEPQDDAPTHAGLVLKAGDTGRILMLQRSLEDEKDPARGKWEFPGGGIEEGDHNSLHGALREFGEEVGHPVPAGGTLQHVWRSGPYVGHVMVIPNESDLPLHHERSIDNPDGDHHEQSAWWDPEHARKNPALRPECKTSPWKEIGGASRGTTATYSSHDALGDFVEDPPTLGTPPVPTDQENPASTGFATAADPPAFDSADARSMHLDMGSFASLHDAPEGALPSTDGADDDTLFDDPGSQMRSEMSDSIDGTEDVDPNHMHASLSTDEIVARFQATAGAKLLSAPTGPSDGDIAKAAKAHLAGLSFTPSEQHELITEGAAEKARARNFGDLDISSTHYEALAKALAELDDPDDCLIV